MLRKLRLVELQRGRHNGVFQRGDTRGEQQRENGKLHGRAGLQTARCLSCIFHGFGFCVFRTLDRAVRECVPYGCAFLTKGNAARWCVFSGNALFIHTCCPAQTTIPVQDANGKLFVAVIGSSRPWTVIYVQDRSRGFPMVFCAPCQRWAKREGFLASKSDGRRGTFEEGLQRCISRGRRSTQRC